MRKILFRGKTKESNEWIQGGLVDYGNGEYAISGTDESGKPVITPVIPETVDESTGRRTGYGELIFENDILRRRDGYLWHVKWYNGHGGFRMINTNLESYVSNNLLMAGEFGVVGNTHDNPELIPEEDEE